MRFIRCVAAAVLLTGCAANAVGQIVPNALAASGQPAASDAYRVTVKYVVTFYPLWFTYEQWKISSVNRLIGPARMTPVYHAVVAPNDDTLYANTLVGVTKEPLILTIPSTKDSYSVLSTDAFGDVNDTGISAAGTYGLTGPHWKGSLPNGVTAVPLPTNYTALIIRVDKYSSSGQDEKAEAELFRRSLRAVPLTQYKRDPKAGHAQVFPVEFFAVPFKTIADELATKQPIAFLTQLQAAVASKGPPSLTPDERALSDRFDSLFNNRGRADAPFSEGTRAAHQMILDAYLKHTDRTKWITFDSIGTTWTNLVRSAIAEFIQYGNSHATAAYYQTFEDANGADLDGASHDYVLTFAKNNIPEAKRFWSVTAYTPDSITLIRNPQHKYLVGSYTPGLQKNRDGSISIYVAQHQPKGVPAANWLPVAAEQFNLMLRVYGPEGKVADNTYVPPAVRTLSLDHL